MPISHRDVILITLCTALPGCMSGNAADTPGSFEEVQGQSAALTLGSRARSSMPTLRPKPAPEKPNIDSPIPFDRPGGNPQKAALPIVSVGTSDSPADGPRLPLGPGIRLPSSADGEVTCKAAPALKLDCPPAAPTASTCTFRDNLPAGCQIQLVPGAMYPHHAYPACCP